MNQPTKSWTVMVYFASDNDLEGFAVNNLMQMKQVGSTDDVTFIAQVDPRGSGPTARYYLHDKSTTLGEDLVQSFGEINTGDPKELTNFINWGMENFPANNYMLILWGHGHGWQGDDNADRAAGRTVNRAKANNLTLAIGQDEFSQNQVVLKLFISLQANDSVSATSEINQALQAATQIGFLTDNGSSDVLTMAELKKSLAAVNRKKIDVLGMDACMMATAEVGYQVREHVDYLVGSEETIPDDSWPYDRIFARLVDNPAMSPADLSVAVAREYTLAYKDKGTQIAISVCDLKKDKFDPLKNAINELCEELLGMKDDADVKWAVMLSRAMVQSFYIKDYIDLYDYCRLLQENCHKETIRVKCGNVLEAIAGKDGKGQFVLDYGYYGFRLRDVKGVSIYFPCRGVSARYDKLEFSIYTLWDEFLEAFVGKAPVATNAATIEAQLLPASENGVKIGRGDEGKIGHGDEAKIGSGDEAKIPGSKPFRLPGKTVSQPDKPNPSWRNPSAEKQTAS